MQTTPDGPGRYVEDGSLTRDRLRNHRRVWAVLSKRPNASARELQAETAPARARCRPRLPILSGLATSAHGQDGPKRGRGRAVD